MPQLFVVYDVCEKENYVYMIQRPESWLTKSSDLKIGKTQILQHAAAIPKNLK